MNINYTKKQGVDVIMHTVDFAVTFRRFDLLDFACHA